MASKEDNLPSLYAELNKYGRNNEFEKALKVANRILGISQDEEAAINCKIVCLIQLGKFNDALQFISKYPKLSEMLAFKKSYCLYRLNQVPTALKVIESIENPSLEVKELKAQILYRLERYEECFNMYRDIIKNSHDDYEDERETNLAAVIANLAAVESKMDIPQLREDTYELTYNAACRLIEQASITGDRATLIEAEKKLRAAEKMCKEALEEEGEGEGDIDSELGIIRVQLGYDLQLQGREKEAQALYMNALKVKSDDISLVAVASNNLVTLNKDHNVFSSKKRMKSATVEGLEHKLTTRQRKNIAYNQCLLALYTNQGEQCQKLCNNLIKDYPDMKAEATFVNAMQLSKEGKTNEAINYLLENASEETELCMKLACVQMLLSQGNRQFAIDILENISDKYRFLSGIVSALVTLYMADNNREKAAVVLKNAVNYYKVNQENTGDLCTLWRQAADFHLRGGEVSVAVESLEALLKVSPSDTKALAQLIIAYAQFSPAKAQDLSKLLPQIDYSTESSFVENLEKSNYIVGPKVNLSPEPDTTTVKKRTKRKRKGKLPKNYNPGVTPDPERWLPRHERSGFRKKRDRRNRDTAMKGTQGTAAGTSDLYDITKMPANVKPSPNSRYSPAVETSGPRQQQRKVQQKKKKKGGKW